ncbi:MAG: M60 family metallopeptidase [Phycisphaerae bacterium]|nr:M60 family metallopeptidase [Phycisphaerae bacterium]
MFTRATFRFLLSVALSVVILAGCVVYGQDNEGGQDSAVQKLDELIAKVKGEKKVQPDKIDEAVNIISRAGEVLPAAEFLDKLDKLQQYREDSVIPTAQKQLSGDMQPDYTILSLQVRKVRDVPAEQVKTHPAAEVFPGPIGENAKPVTQTIKINTSAAGWHIGGERSLYWHSTGLYAVPGEVITVIVPKEVTEKGLYVRIGAHSDRLWRKSSWARAPEICRRFALTQAETKAANAFGGLVYIETPYDLMIGEITVTVDGAVRAPYYVLGKTDAEKWRQTIRNHPAPWGELAGRKLILTLPSKVLRTVDDPEDLMKFWDSVMDRYAELLGRYPQRRRLERFVPDVQISAGYMHAGYPLMTMMDITTTIVDKERIISNRHGGVWGLFHEIGHNHQNYDWTFRGTGEVTVNLFSLYIMDKVCDVPDKGHPSITKQARKRNTDRYFADGCDFEKWKRDPFLALCMYIQLQETFGWEPFTKVFKEYRTLTEEQRPQSDDEKRDQWMVRFSRAVGRNLGPFFEAWAVPTTEKARSSIADLPGWMPDGFPPEDVKDKRDKKS